MRISDWSSDVCSSDLVLAPGRFCLCPGTQSLRDGDKAVGPAIPQILPGEIFVPSVPARLARAGRGLLSHQAQIAARDRSLPRILARTVADGKGIELLQICDRMACLVTHPHAQTGLQDDVPTFSSSEWKRIPSPPTNPPPL